MSTAVKNRIRAALAAALAVCALAVCALCAPAGALEDFTYSGPLDVETGEPAQSGASSDAYSDRVYIAGGVYYDRTRQGFLYTVDGSTAQVLCTAADGMAVQESVQIVPDTGVEVTVYRDGTAMESPDLTHIYETGDYVVEAGVGGRTTQLLAFSIVGDVTCRMTGYSMPAGFAVTGAELDGAELSYDRGFVSMAREGHYVIDYRCARSGVSYELDVSVDTTPPVLALAEVDEKGQARGPVSLADIEEGASIGITLDGKQIPYSTELTDSGEYQIILMDRAGNVTRYQFTILIYFDMNSLLFFGLLLAAAGAVGIYIFVSRKRLQVR